MGDPPLITCPYSHPTTNEKNSSENYQDNSETNRVTTSKQCFINKSIFSFRSFCIIHFTFVLLFFYIVVNLESVSAGPVAFNLDYMQAPVPLARNIRHLPCISRKTGQEGLCMFAIDCLKANGSHLGTCIDRFYFGSCCQIPDKTLLPQIIGNTIEDNTIDSANFVHPQTQDKYHTNVLKKPTTTTTTTTTTEKIETTSPKSADITEPLAMETKSDDDDSTTIDNNIINDDVKLTTAIIIETTTKSENKITETVTEIPIKLSTFQTVSGESNIVTEAPKATTETIKSTTEPTILTTESMKVTEDATPIPTTTQKHTMPTRKPVRPTYTRPPFKPYNYTRPSYSQSTLKPKPVVTKRPSFRPPLKRPTKKPLPLPPRLNITILPQSTSSKPVFTKPSSVSIIYINTTNLNAEEIDSSLTTTTTTSTTEPPTTENVTEDDKEVTSVSPIPEIITDKIAETPIIDVVPADSATEVALEDTNIVTQKITDKTTTSPIIPTMTPTDFPPLVTWTNTVDSATKEPEKITEPSEETWSPITPPEGWVLITTPPKTETPTSILTTITTPATTTSTTTHTTTTSTTANPTTTISTTKQPIITTTTERFSQETTVQITTTEKPKTTSSMITRPPTTQLTTTTTTTTTTESINTNQGVSTEKLTSPVTPTSSITQTTSEEQSATTSEAPVKEFTVNVTLSPTMPTSTLSMEQTTPGSSSPLNVTETTTLANTTASPTTISGDNSTSGQPDTTPTPSVETTTEFVNMSDYKNVCGRRLWHAPQGRIVGGKKSGFGQWPWQISLRQYRTSTYLHKCGAALLNENWAITAAHCVEHVPPSELLLRLGEHDLANEDEPYGFVERRVQIIASHPHFDPATFEYDLALLRFYEPVNFQPNILPICVPDNDADYVGKTAHVTGWGRLFDEGPLPSVLQEVEVPVINNSECEAMYKAADYNEHIPYIFICAGRTKGGADSCEGDSGGPMVIRRESDNRFVLGGIISWGIGCAEPNQPGVYTRISEFRDWINQILTF